MRRLPFKNVLNMRDLGGYPAEGGACTKFGRMIRSDIPGIVSKEEADTLLAMGITTVVDLRSPEEIDKLPCALAGYDGFAYHTVNLMNRMLPDKKEEVGLCYFEAADECENVRRVMSIIANAPAGTLFHCLAGKDRTGIIAALLLLCCGVPLSDALADYQQTHTYLRETVRRMSADNPSFPEHVWRSDIEYMEDFIALLCAKYGSVPGYLEAAGVTEDELKSIRLKLLP